LHNVRDKINIRLDNGSEFVSSSKRKLEEYNDFFSKLNAKAKTDTTRCKAYASYCGKLTQKRR